MNRILYFLAFVIGLAVVGWVGAGYVSLNPLALAVTAIIALVYIVGAIELYRYQKATNTLEHALNALSETPASLPEWLSKLDPSLRDAARARVEGGRVGLPGPALTPYLVGLLVLLGMLGTFLGMVATLRGTGLALENATDLQAIRASLAAPITGLGFAFGTSVAGVATSAMLGLLAAFCRRDRARAARRLDAQAATTLRVYSQAHQREESLRLLQDQAQALPLVADRLQAMLGAMEQHSLSLSEKLASAQEAFHAKSDARQAELEQRTLALNERVLAGQEAQDAKSAGALEAIRQQNQELHERLLAGQEAFHDKATLAYSKLIASTQTMHSNLVAATEAAHLSLVASTETAHSNMLASTETVHSNLLSSTEAAHSKLAASTEAAYSKLADSTHTAYTSLSSSVEASLKSSMEESTRAVGTAIQPLVESTFANLAQENAALQRNIQQAVQQHLEGLAGKLELSSTAAEQSMAKAAGLWTEALIEHKRASEALVDEQRRISESLIKQHQLANESILKTQAEAGASLLQEQKSVGEQLGTSLHSSMDAFTETFEQRSASLVDSIAARLDKTGARLAEDWGAAMALQQSTTEKLATDNQQALAGAIASLEQHAASLVRQVGESNDSLREALASQDSQRLAAWADAFADATHALRDEWKKTSDHTAARQQEICDTLARTASDVATQTREHAADTIAEIERLITAASEAPKVAAEVVAEVRDKLSDSMARDNAMLEERGRMLETLATLLDAVNHASNEQRTAVDALLSNSSNLLDRIGTQVTDKVEAEAGKLGYMASQVSGSAIEIATLGDSFGKAVQSFSDSNASLMQHLQRVEETLQKSIERSDEQLAYYVAQAREVIDLSMLSQKQILEQLQHSAEANGTRVSGGSSGSGKASRAGKASGSAQASAQEPSGATKPDKGAA